MRSHPATFSLYILLVSLGGQFLSDLLSNDLDHALEHLPHRLLISTVLAVLWSLAIWILRRRKRTFR